MRIISIDPGYERLGIAVIEKLPKQKTLDKTQGKEVLIFSECFKTKSTLPHEKRLGLIGEEIEKIIKKYKPEVLATEKLFFSGNQKTAMLVAEARGVILYTGQKLGLKIFEYRPNEVKIAITGYGASEKRQIIEMVKKLIVCDQISNSDDEFDAIAIGLTHFAINK